LANPENCTKFRKINFPASGKSAARGPRKIPVRGVSQLLINKITEKRRERCAKSAWPNKNRDKRLKRVANFSVSLWIMFFGGVEKLFVPHLKSPKSSTRVPEVCLLGLGPAEKEMGSECQGK